MRGVFLDSDSLAPKDLNLSSISNTLEQWDFFPATTAEQTLEHIGDASVVVTNKVVIDETTMAACPQLKLICVSATGTNNIDLKAAGKHNITVCNAIGYGTASVVQHTLALILSLTNRLSDYNQAAKNGTWEAAPFFCLLDYPVMQLAGKKLGIIGYGELGKSVAQLARSLGMDVLISQRPGTEEQPCPTGRLSLNTVLAESDLLTLHCPLTEETENLIGQEQLTRMKPGSFLINCARGGIVNEGDLADALRTGHLGGAACDVLSKEPPTADNPLLANDIPNLILTPHMAWASREARQRLVDIVADNILCWREGNPKNIV